MQIATPRSPRSRSLGALVLAAASVVAMCIAFLPVTDRIVFNDSASMPTGFYLRTDGAPVRHAIVTVRARDVAPDYARLRDFTGDRDRFLKRVAAVAGDEVCADGARVVINGALASQRSERDSAGRVLPSWSGCHVLRTGEVFLLGDTPDSFDGRYWGPINASAIEGVWRSL